MKSGGDHGKHVLDIHLHRLEVTVYTVSKGISYHSKSLPSRIGESMLYLDSYPADLAIHLFVLFCERMKFCCFLWCEDILECYESTISVSKKISELPNLHIIDNWTIMFLALVCFGDEENPFVFGCDNPVFNRVSFLFPGIVFLLDFVFLGSLYSSFAPVQEELFEVWICLDELLYTPDPPLWENNLPSKGFLKERKILHYPIMSSSFTGTVPKESHHLKREIETYIGEYEEELLSARNEETFSSSSKSSFFGRFIVPSLD